MPTGLIRFPVIRTAMNGNGGCPVQKAAFAASRFFRRNRTARLISILIRINMAINPNRD